MNILKTIIGAIVPRLSKEKCKAESVDTLISKRGSATQLEVMTALVYKYLRLALYAYMIISVVSGKVSLGEIMKVLALNIGS